MPSLELRGSGPILMVDDSEDDRYIAARCYRKSRLEREFVTLESGESLLGYLEEVLAGSAPMPAIVLLDVNMPALDGFQVLQRMRARSEFAEVPVVVMLTHSDDPEDAAWSLEQGANAYRTKPSDLAEFVSFFDSLLE